MGDVGLFIAGVLITIPAAAGIVGLVIAAIADGRENDRIQAQRKAEEGTSVAATSCAADSGGDCGSGGSGLHCVRRNLGAGQEPELGAERGRPVGGLTAEQRSEDVCDLVRRRCRGVDQRRRGPRGADPLLRRTGRSRTGRRARAGRP